MIRNNTRNQNLTSHGGEYRSYSDMKNNYKVREFVEQSNSNDDFDE